MRNPKKGQENKVTTLSDNILLEQIGCGDEASFETVFHQHYDRVYGLLFRLVGNRAEAEDLTQDVFIKLHHHALQKRFLVRQREHNIGAWLYRTATNAGYNALRSRKRRWQRDTLLVPDPQGIPGAEAEAERRERETAVRQALAQLPERQVQLLLLRQMGFSYAECAAACDVAPGSVGTLLARAMKAFRQVYEAEKIS
ncbi:MAG TPA: sigma-70 family RNA polymerase sigma factor [Anaerolineae bacterium]|nr:sigma-70 family RNA polymerase sigma factor [Anaerolineae bacterium]HIP73066.1 sigma-70 family RNA polymerase sigma factor [Anaerolineae bacterium]